MSDTTNYDDTKIKSTEWSGHDLNWVFCLFGTALGGGILYLPVAVGKFSFLSVCICLILALPMVIFAHRNICQMSIQSHQRPITLTHVIQDHLGTKVAVLYLTGFYFAMIMLLCIYCLAIVNILHQLLTYTDYSIDRGWLSFWVTFVAIFIMRFFENYTTHLVKYLVYILIGSILLSSIILIPYWNISRIFQLAPNLNIEIKSIFFLFPLVLFTFNYIHVCSPLVNVYRSLTGHKGWILNKVTSISKYNAYLLFIVIVSFTISCVLSMDIDKLLEAREKNLPVFAFLGHIISSNVLDIVGIFLSFLALSSSFFGTYLSAYEGFLQISIYRSKKNKNELIHNLQWAKNACAIVVGILGFFISFFNYDIINIIEIMITPLMFIGYILPVIALYVNDKHSNEYLKENPTWQNIYVLIMGVVALSGYLVSEIL